MEGEDYENKKDNLQSASGMPGIFRHILWQHIFEENLLKPVFRAVHKDRCGVGVDVRVF